ncbi:hypothetical protein [Rhodopila sp.]|uniref:hypothetical protein n=1 Tax=Rhodopila sp. TaxID=2480087 RepID=UPI003D132A5E
MMQSLALLHRLAENLDAVLIWALVATALMTTVLQGSQGLGLSRLSLPFLFGTFVTADRGRAVLVGSLIYLAGGWAFAVLYFFIFASLGAATWWIGAALGALHGLFLLVSLPVMALIHPRIASAYDAPASEPKLEPPGFIGLNYGYRTPLTTLLAQALYGAILGGFLPMR